MAIEQLSTERIEQLIGNRHQLAGFEYPENGLQPYYQWLMRTIHVLGESSAGWLQVHKDDSSDTVIRTMPGRATIDGVVYYHTGETLDLASFNNDEVYVWLCESGGEAAIAVDSISAGWPSSAHLKLAEVSIDSGVINQIIDRRSERFLTAGPMPELIGKLPEYDLQLTIVGDTANPSELIINLRDITGSDIAEADYLRVRICDQDGYACATNATIATVGNYTQTIETITAGKDLIVKCTQGLYEFAVSNAVAQTMTFRIGPADIGVRRCDYSASLDITHS